KRHPVGTSSHKMFTSLGIVLFHALDYGLCEDEERSLGKPLELLIERLTSAHEIARRRQRKKSRSSNHEAHHQDMHSLGSFYDDDHLDDDEVDEEDEDECANADEGIERDCHEDGDSPSSSAQTSQLVDFDHILQMCVSRLSSRESADSHYKAVCRALIAETLELSTFLDQIAKGTKELRKSSSVVIGSSNSSGNESEATLEKLQFHDWARLWIQVIRELRYGVKLKKVDTEDLIHNTEYELTPYEVTWKQRQQARRARDTGNLRSAFGQMLLDDIRSRRYKLNKVMINGGLPLRLKKDAHELILDFIRSRPPLVPVSKRVLKPPPPKEVTLYERLMDSIRQEHKLRPTPRPETTFHSLSANTTPLPRHRSVTLTTDDLPAVSSGTTGTSFSSHDRLFKSASQTAARRKLIKANITLNLPLDDDEADEDEQIQALHSGRTARPMSAYFASEIASFDEHDTSMNGTGEEPNCEEKKEDKEEAKEGASKEAAEDQVDGDDKENNSKARILQLKRFSTKLFSRERRHSISGLDTKSLKLHNNAPSDIIENLNFEEDSRNLVATIWESTELGKSLECLSLTLKEVQHIRSVLTKAEIESLGVTKSLKTDLENGKICFTCLKTRFTFWGPWATVCKLCNRSICDRCATKMHIPTEQFERVPIYCLSPSPSPPNEKTTAELFNWPKLDASCENHKDATSESENEGESKSLPPKIKLFSQPNVSHCAHADAAQ
ncbi:actin binding, partial [Tyrophagus putrescentiae]